MELLMDGLGKRYKSGAWGLRGLTLTLEPGTILGLIGPAGAGKTTLLRMLATVMPPTEGAITWDGVDVVKHPDALRPVLGYLPQYFGVYAALSGRVFLQYVAALKGVSGRAGRLRVAELIDRLGLSEIADQAMGRYPNGMRWRVGLAQALLNDPQLLLVDEPGLPLSLEERSRFCDLLGTLAGYRLVIVATDDVEDVAATAAAIALLKGGRLYVPDIGPGSGPTTTPERLVGSVRSLVWSLTVSRDALVEVRRQHLISGSERQGNQTQLRIVSAVRPHPDAVLVEPTLQDAYTYHIGGHVNESAFT
jgi:ABC-2 type transport system ATP-binding protein